MPLIYSFIGLTDQEYAKKKKEKLKSRDKRLKPREERTSSTPQYITDKEFTKPYTIILPEDDDSRYSK